MGAGAGGTAVRIDGEYVGGAAQGADGHPATVRAEAHVLDLGSNREELSGQTGITDLETLFDKKIIRDVGRRQKIKL